MACPHERARQTRTIPAPPDGRGPGRRLMATRDTRTQMVFEGLRSDILAGRLQPGQRLPFSDLGRRYSASVGVLREGLSRLAEQGLVEAEPRHGFRVTPVSTDDLQDLTTARVTVESIALAASIEHGDIQWESHLIAVHHVLERTDEVSPDDPHRLTEEWASAHGAFHATLLAACPNRHLRQIAEALRSEAELYRRWSRQFGAEDDRDVSAEHRLMLDAALKHDVAGAVGLLTAHIGRTATGLARFAEVEA